MALTLKAARQIAGYTQQEAASLLEISRLTLRSYEQYKTVPSIEMAVKIARLYKTTVDNIIFFIE